MLPEIKEGALHGFEKKVSFIFLKSQNSVEKNMKPFFHNQALNVIKLMTLLNY